MGDLIVTNVVGMFLMIVVPIVVGGVYLIFSGQLKLFLLLLTLMVLVVGHFALSYYMNSDPLVLPRIIRSYGEWFFNKN